MHFPQVELIYYISGFWGLLNFPYRRNPRKTDTKALDRANGRGGFGSQTAADPIW